MTSTRRNVELTPEAYHKLINTAQDLKNRYGFTVYVLGQTGMRTGEIAHFRPEWFDADSNLITVPESQDNWQPKARKEQVIPISADATDTISWYLNTLDNDVYGWSENSIRRHVAVVSEKAGMDSTSPQQIRSAYYREMM